MKIIRQTYGTRHVILNVIFWSPFYLFNFYLGWFQVLQLTPFLLSCSQRVGDSQWWGSLTMIPAGNKAKRFPPVNRTTKAIHHHHNHYHHHHLNHLFIELECEKSLIFTVTFVFQKVLSEAYLESSWATTMELFSQKCFSAKKLHRRCWT